MAQKDIKFTYFQLFKETFVLSAFTFGGGFVIIAMMKKRFVEQLHWISENEMLDLVTIAQSAPGVLAVNASIIVGRKLGGFKGSIVSLIGTVLPPFIILSIISLIYKQFVSNYYVNTMLQGMQAGVAAVILMAAYSMLASVMKIDKIYNLSAVVISVVLSYFFNVSVIYLLLAALVVTLLINYVRSLKRRKLK